MSCVRSLAARLGSRGRQDAAIVLVPVRATPRDRNTKSRQKNDAFKSMEENPDILWTESLLAIIDRTPIAGYSGRLQTSLKDSENLRVYGWWARWWGDPAALSRADSAR